MKLHLSQMNWTEQFINSSNDKKTSEMWSDVKYMMMNMRNLFVPKQLGLKKPIWKTKGSLPINKKLQEAIQKKH